MAWTPRRIQLLAVSVPVFWAGMFLLEYYWSTKFPVFSIALLGALLLALAFLSYRKLVLNFQLLRKEARDGFAQVDSWLRLYERLQLRRSLPRMRSFAASPDLLNLMIDLVEEAKPNLIVECGSGVSTLVNGYLLEKMGKGKVIASEHHAQFGAESSQRIQEHGLDAFAKVRIAPLEKQVLAGKEWWWYAAQGWTTLQQIDLLIVDGPPDATQDQARYPALPLLWDHLSPHAVILVDDCIRATDRTAVERWLREFPELSATWISTEKGACILRRNAATH
ncbi:MAG: class I SAM-dependent methyltransferase [Phaeodactylibacter sp.]|nr:class I SAM-dependent methyltransferase [Phaeodactylibacter sp.]